MCVSCRVEINTIFFMRVCTAKNEIIIFIYSMATSCVLNRVVTCVVIFNYELEL
jgi:hypothetical protein